MFCFIEDEVLFSFSYFHFGVLIYIYIYYTINMMWQTFHPYFYHKIYQATSG